MGEVCTFGSEAIEIRSFDQAIAVGTNAVPAVLIRHNEQNIRFDGIIVSRVRRSYTSQADHTGGEQDESKLAESRWHYVTPDFEVATSSTAVTGYEPLRQQISHLHQRSYSFEAVRRKDL